MSNAQAGGQSGNLSTLSIPAFSIPASIIGNLGEQLEYGLSDTTYDALSHDCTLQDVKALEGGFRSEDHQSEWIKSSFLSSDGPNVWFIQTLVPLPSPQHNQ